MMRAYLIALVEWKAQIDAWYIAEVERCRNLPEPEYGNTTPNVGIDSDPARLEWLAASGRRMVQLGKNWSIPPRGTIVDADTPWYPTVREAIDAERLR